MSERPKHKSPPSASASRVGAKEVLTEDLARKIARLVQNFPDTGIPVTWENIIVQVKLRFGREFRRNVLAQKEWGGRRLIHEAFNDAKAVQRRDAHDRAPKYAKEPRSRLRLLVAKLQSEILALRETLEKLRSAQYDEIFALLDTRTPLNRAVEARSQGQKVLVPQHTQHRSEPVTVEHIDSARAKRAQGYTAEKHLGGNDDS